MSIVEDIQNNFRLNQVFEHIPGSEKVIQSLEYDYGEHGVDSGSLGALSDMRRSWVRFLVEEKWFFYYEHIHQFGDIATSDLKIYDVSNLEKDDDSEEKDIWEMGREKDDGGEKVFDFFQMNLMMFQMDARKAMDKGEERPDRNDLKERALLDKFCEEYELELSGAFTMFGILCSFPFGQAVVLNQDGDDHDYIVAYPLQLKMMIPHVYELGETTPHAETDAEVIMRMVEAMGLNPQEVLQHLEASSGTNDNDNDNSEDD